MAQARREEFKAGRASFGQCFGLFGIEADVEGGEVVPELFGPAGPEDGGRDVRLPGHPPQGHLRQWAVELAFS